MWALPTYVFVVGPGWSSIGLSIFTAAACYLIMFRILVHAALDAAEAGRRLQESTAAAWVIPDIWIQRRGRPLIKQLSLGLAQR